MKQIGGFLEKFAKILRDGDEAREVVFDACNKAGLKLKDIQSVSICGQVATLKLSPAQKSELFLKQKRILDEIAKHPLTKGITVVR